MVTIFGEPVATGIHYAQRELTGSVDTWSLPLCWHAEIAARLGTDQAADDEAWWLAVDHGAIVPEEILITANRAKVTCSACLEWIHA
jgi:hypothetical protein